MDRTAYAAMDTIERSHWWYVARRKVLAALIARQVPLRGSARILDASCGTGGNLPFLGAFGNLDACEYDAEARDIARRKTGIDVVPAAFPDDLERLGSDYDLITVLDVLEHIDDDEATLRALGRRLSMEGRLLVTVPAIPQLWSAHDTVHHHLRRYTRDGLRQVVKRSGLHDHAIGYFNSLLFPLAVIQRIGSRISGRDEANLTMPSRWLNATLRTIFASEASLIGRVPMPIGLSLYAIIGREAKPGS